MSKIKCDENCAECGKYTSVHFNGGEYIKYDCLLADRTVTKSVKKESEAK